jgi:hypothetical protein
MADEAELGGAASPPAPKVLALQASAIVDSTVRLADAAALAAVVGDGPMGGSVRVTAAELEALLEKTGVEPEHRAGGSAANTLRARASGFGVPCSCMGGVGDDEFGQVFTSALADAGVAASALQVQAGKPTGRCAVLVSDADGQRTMRTVFDGAAALDPVRQPVPLPAPLTA